MLVFIWFLLSGVIILSGIGWWLTAWFVYRGIDADVVRLGAVGPASALWTLSFWIMQWGAPLLFIGLGSIFGAVGIRSFLRQRQNAALAATLR